MKQKIHIFGASGAGTTTIAQSVCQRINYRHFDSDSYYWLPTEEPFTAERPLEECLTQIQGDLSHCERWILSGSLTGWGDALIPNFDLIIFVYVQEGQRMERLKKREYERYGTEIYPGGKRFEASEAFLAWAGAYDAGTQTGRSLVKHETWLEKVDCPIIRITNDSLANSVDTVIKAIKES